MFNAMTNAEVVLAVGRVLREAASIEGEPDEYHRSQMLSAYSVARHLAAEEADAAGRMAWFRTAVADELDGDVATAIRATDDPARMGELVGDLFAQRRTDPDAAALCTRLRALLRELADREVAALVSPPM